MISFFWLTVVLPLEAAVVMAAVVEAVLEAVVAVEASSKLRSAVMSTGWSP
jgi:hypothetical protein